MTTITRERLLKIQQWSETYGAGSNVMLPAEEAEELARIALAALEAEPVVPESISVRQAISALESADCVTTIGQAYKMGWNACRAAMLQGGQPVSNHDELPYAQVKAVADLFALCWQSGEVVTYTPDPEKATIWLNNYSGTCVQEYVKLERLQEALAGNSPVTPDGWKQAPEKADEDMIAEGNIMASCMIETVGKIDVSLIYGAMLAAAPEKETGPCTK